MAGLLYKELILNKKSMLISLAGILFISIYALIPISLDLFQGTYPLVMSVICVIIFVFSGSSQQSIFHSDEREKWADFIISTPLSVKGQVQSKYYFSLLISIATLIYCMVLFDINAVIQGADSQMINIYISLFLFQIFCRAIEFPFLIRFGNKYGNNLRIALGFGITFLIMVYGLFGDMSIFGSLDDFIEWFIKLVSGRAFSDAMLIIIAFLPIIYIGIYYLSYKLSCKLYLKGVENYDE